MESKVRILLGILLVPLLCYQAECASIHHFRPVRNVDFPDGLNTTDINKISVTSTTQSIPSSTQDKISKVTERTVNKIETKSVDSVVNESVEDAKSSKDKQTVSRGSIKYETTTRQQRDEDSDKKELQTNKKNENKLIDNKGTDSKETVNKGTDTKKTDNKEIGNNESKEESNVHKNEEVKVTGRSLNIDIEKYVSPEFHNKNNVYSLPTSPEIEKYVETDSDEFSEDTTKPSISRRIFTSRTTKNDFNTDLTTPQSDIFDSKFQTLVDGIKQNLDELSSVTDNDEDEKAKLGSDTTINYDVSKLLDNYENADNETDVSLETKEFRNIEVKTNKNKGNKDEESGKNVNYESTRLKTYTYDDNPDNDKTQVSKEADDSLKHESRRIENSLTKKPSDATTLRPASTTFVPSKRPRFQISLRNNTIETTASESEVKPKSIKHFSYESSSLDPLYEIEKATYSKPVHENAINISKRGSTKLVGPPEDPKPTTARSFMDYDNKNFSIPPTASAWTLVSMKDVRTETNKNDNSNEQNSQENNLVKVQLTTPKRKESTTETSTSTENDVTSTTKFYRISSTIRGFYNYSKDNENTTEINDDLSTTTEDDSTEINLNETSSTLKSLQSDQPFDSTDESTEQTTLNFKSTEIMESTTEQSSTITEITTSNIDITTESNDSQELTTIVPETTFRTTTEDEITTTFDENDGTTQSSTDPSSTTISSGKFDPTKTETDNELYTTSRSEGIISSSILNVSNISSTESTTQSKTTEKSTSTTPFRKFSTISSQIETEDDNSEEDYSEVVKKGRTTTDVNDLGFEVSHETSTTKKSNDTTPISVFKDQKGILPNSNEIENTTVDTTSSTDMLSHDESPDESNSGMIAAIAISSVGGVCLIILAGLLLIMRKRQKRVTYGQRCRPVSLDAYSLDNVSVYNSVRRKGALRASKRSYGNPAFDDPTSISHQMNFQVLVKFAENSEGISGEFDEIPQVTARANEVPPGCETKNRYANVIPLPETRVFLKASDNDPHSDYINANYVTGPKNTRGYYIACQAPLQNTVDDFWRMIWEQQSRVILMLTNLYENGIEKCADYLPPSEVVDCHRLFGDFQITLKKREVKEKYIISSLQLKNMVSNSWREVTHLWYLGWPERGVPTEANSLIAFLIEARSHLKAASNNNSSNGKMSESSNTYISNAAGPAGNGTPDSGPMVVHCSPGTGRTGTVISCDIAIRDFELTRAVDVPKIVYRVRRDRASAVQTRDQYAFIYKVISLYATKLTGGALDPI